MPTRLAGLALRIVFLVSALAPSLALSQATTRSQSDPRPVAQAALRQGEITIDGRLDESAWSAAKPITELSQSSPDEGKPASQKTEIRFLYDASALYIGARMYDSLGTRGIRSALARRDQVMHGDNNLTSDRIAFVFDTFRDKNSRTWFELNPDGVKGDHQNGDASYDPVWEGATKIDSLGGPEFPIRSYVSPAPATRSGVCRSGVKSIGATSRTCGRFGAATNTVGRLISGLWKE